MPFGSAQWFYNLAAWFRSLEKWASEMSAGFIQIANDLDEARGVIDPLPQGPDDPRFKQPKDPIEGWENEGGATITAQEIAEGPITTGRGLAYPDGTIAQEGRGYEEFYSVKHRRKVRVPRADVVKRTYERETSKGTQTRYALQVETTVDGDRLKLTKFVGKEEFDRA